MLVFKREERNSSRKRSIYRHICPLEVYQRATFRQRLHTLNLADDDGVIAFVVDGPRHAFNIGKRAGQ
jgi:hypothetical protein